MRIQAATLVALSSLFVACTSQDDAGPQVVEPTLDGKADGFGDVEEGGQIDFGDEVRGAFDADFQFFVYRFFARSGAEVTAEVTQLGSSQGLDTTMFLYAMQDGEEPQRIVFDDDDGFGALSRVDEFRLFETGQYAIVLGTKDANGRGNFRLTLGCDSGQCEPLESPCPKPMQDEFFECVVDASAEFDLESPLDDVVSDFCGTPLDLQDMRTVLCDNQSHPWCQGQDTIDACLALAQDAYPPVDRALDLLTSADEPAALESLVEAARGSEFCGFEAEDAGCEFFGTMFTYDPNESLTMEELLAHSRTLASPGPGVYPQQQTGSLGRQSFNGFMNFFEVSEDAASMIESMGLSLEDAEFGTTDGPQFQAFFGDCEGGSAVLHFPAEGIVFDFNTLTCFG